MKHHWILLLFAAVGTGGMWPSSATAQESLPPLITDRPDFTESPQTVPSGRVQVETGATVERVADSRRATYGEVLVRVAAGRGAELRIGIPSYVAVREGGRAAGLDDGFLGAKLVLLRSAKAPLALLVGTTLPTGAAEVAERRYQPDAVLSTAFELSGTAGLGVNVGAGRPTDAGTRFTQLFGSGSLGVELSERVGAFAEVFAFNRTRPGGRNQQFVDGGVTYGLSPDLQLDGRVGVGIANGAGGQDWFYGIGVTRRF